MPARVQPLSSPSSWTGALPSQAPQPLTVSRMVPAETLLQEHRMASSGSSVSGGVAAAGRGEVGAGLGGQLAAEHGAQGGVGRGVADEDAAEQGLGVVGDDDLLVDAAGGVGVDDLERVLGAGEGVAEAGDVDAGELELGGGVEAGEGRVAAVQAVGDDLGHRVGGGHEAQAHAAEVGDLADRPDAGDLRGAVVGDDDAAALAELELLRCALCGAEQLVAGPHADRDDHEVGVDDPAVGHEDAGDLAVVVGEDLGGEHPAVDGEALGLDEPAERLPGALVQLGVHEPRRAVDDDRGGAELFGAGG